MGKVWAGGAVKGCVRGWDGGCVGGCVKVGVDCLVDGGLDVGVLGFVGVGDWDGGRTND